MRTEQVVTIVVALLVPMVTGVVGSLGILFQDWRARRSRAGRRKLALEDATRQVAFATEWWKARQSLDPKAGPQDLAILAVSLPLAIGLRSWALSFETTKVGTAPSAQEATDRVSGVRGP